MGEKSENKSGSCTRIVVAIIVAVGACVAAFIALWQPVIGRLAEKYIPLSAASSSTPRPFATSTAGFTSAAPAENAGPAPTSTFPPTSLPTLPPTFTPAPQPTLTPTISVALPFSDNFDEGISPNWKTITGNWRTLNGRLVADTSNDYSEIMLGDQNSQNYTVDVDVFSNSAAGFPVGIIVRSSNGRFLMFKTDCCSTDWILVDGPSENTIAHVDKGGLTFALYGFAKNHLRVEVNGQTFTGYIDGRQFLQVTDSTNASGAVGIMSQSPFEDRLLFDNFTVTSP